MVWRPECETSARRTGSSTDRARTQVWTRSGLALRPARRSARATPTVVRTTSAHSPTAGHPLDEVGQAEGAHARDVLAVLEDAAERGRGQLGGQVGGAEG